MHIPVVTFREYVCEKNNKSKHDRVNSWGVQYEWLFYGLYFSVYFRYLKKNLNPNVFDK